MIRTIMPNKKIVPVEGSTEGLSRLAQRIHAWSLGIYQRDQKPVAVSDIMHMFGKQHKVHKKALYLPDFPLEELEDASLLYVAEEAE